MKDSGRKTSYKRKELGASTVGSLIPGIKGFKTSNEVLEDAGLQTSDIDMLIPHQANLRIASFVQKRLGLREDKVFNNIQKYGNTTAASVPIAFCEAWEAGKIKAGDLVCLAAFGSGFTWGAALLRF